MKCSYAAAILAVLVWGVGSGALAHEFRLGQLEVDHPWALPLPPVARNGAAYMVIINHGQEPDRLLRAASSVAERAEIHEHREVDGVMMMREVAALDLPPGDRVELVPGGFHVMLLGLRSPLREGGRFALSLEFERAGTVEVEVHVETPPQGAHGHGHHHH
jgi:periplasmic copper chaperone A